MASSFVPAHTFVGDASAPRLAFLLHGALGSSQNLRRIARRLAAEVPSVRHCLVDLRGHGASHAAPGPHDIAHCAADLRRLATELRAAPDVVIGHSLGGKVALAYARDANTPPGQVWTLDSDPGAGNATTEHDFRRVLAAARGVPLPIERREHAVQALTERGLPSTVAQWLATSLERRTGAPGHQGEHYAWKLDFDAVEELVQDYRSADLWPLAESSTRQSEIHFVVAGRSAHWTAEARERAATLAPEARVHLHLLHSAGHWLHADDPEGLVHLIAPRLAALSA
jgi:pimeloyl-ACP methyl ester carboxylesterase